MSNKIGSWVNNITTWFQTKRNQDRDATTNQTHSIEKPSFKTEHLSRRVLDIMNKPKGLEEEPVANPNNKHKR